MATYGVMRARVVRVEWEGEWLYRFGVLACGGKYI